VHLSPMLIVGGVAVASPLKPVAIRNSGDVKVTTLALKDCYLSNRQIGWPYSLTFITLLR
jgi:hypothetical protein